MNNRPRLMIADDHVVVGESLSLLLARWFDIVAVVDQFGHIVPTAQRLHPDAVLLDYSFGPAGNCMPLIGVLRNDVPTCRVVVLTAHDSAALADTALGAGASAFVSKTASPHELCLAIEAALRADPDSGRRRRRTGRRRANGDDAAVHAGPPLEVTPREAAVLLMMYSGMTQAEIAGELGVVPKTVEYYRYKVGKRIGITKLPLLLRWVAEHQDALARIAPEVSNNPPSSQPRRPGSSSQLASRHEPAERSD